VPRSPPRSEVMSALGQKPTFASQNVISALPPKADMCGAARDVRFGPIADIRTATKWFSIRQLRWASTRRAVCICKLLNRLYAFRDVYYVHAPPEMAAGYRHAPISIHFAFGRDRTSNVRQVRRTDVAHANRAGRTRLGEAYFRVSSLPKRGDRGRQISIGWSSAMQIWPHRQIKPTFAGLFNSCVRSIEEHFCSFRLR
jgi:hypothetical protein